MLCYYVLYQISGQTCSPLLQFRVLCGFLHARFSKRFWGHLHMTSKQGRHRALYSRKSMECTVGPFVLQRIVLRHYSRYATQLLLLRIRGRANDPLQPRGDIYTPPHAFFTHRTHRLSSSLAKSHSQLAPLFYNTKSRTGVWFNRGFRLKTIR